MKVIKAIGMSELDARNGKDFFLWAVCSWNTGASEDNYSSYIMTVRAVLGEQHKNNWFDTIPVAAKENPKTREDIFNKKDYRSEQRATGRQRLIALFHRLLNDPSRPGIVIVDTNEVCFGDDRGSPWKDIHEMIVDDDLDLDMELVLNIRNEIYVYTHIFNPQSIIVQRPFCLASSSIEGASMEDRIKRGLTAGTLCNVQRFVNGLAFLSPAVQWGNIVEAMVAYQIHRNGLHGGLRQSAAMFRHFCRLDETETPLTKNDLGKITGEVPKSLRSAWRHRHPEDVRKATANDCKVVLQARRLICNHPDLEGKCDSEEDAREVMGPIFDGIFDLFCKPGDSSREVIKIRLDSLKKHFTEESFFRRLIDERWRKIRWNSGNPMAYGITNEQLVTNNDNCDTWIESFAPQDGQKTGQPFWIRLGDSERELGHIQKALGNERHKRNKGKNKKVWSLVDFPGPCKDIYGGEHCFMGLRERISPRKRKGESLHIRATRHSRYGLHQEFTVGTRDRRTFYTLVHIVFKNGSSGEEVAIEGSGDDAEKDKENDWEWPSDDVSQDITSTRRDAVGESDPTIQNTSRDNHTDASSGQEATNESTGSDTHDTSPRPENRPQLRPDTERYVAAHQASVTDASSGQEATNESTGSDTDDTDDATSHRPENLPKLDPKQESYVAALKNYHSENNGTFPSGRTPGFEKAFNWAKNYRSQYKSRKKGDDHPIVIHLKAIGWMDYNAAEHIQSGNKGWNNQDRNEMWNQRCNELNHFVKKSGGLDDLRKRNKELDKKYKSLARWVEDNKPQYKKKYWTKDPKVNEERFKKLSNIRGWVEHIHEGESLSSSTVALRNLKCD